MLISWRMGLGVFGVFGDYLEECVLLMVLASYQSYIEVCPVIYACT